MIPSASRRRLADGYPPVIDVPDVVTGAANSKGNGHMAVRGKLALFVVALLAVEVIVPPVAGARPTCQSTPSKTICETNGSVSIKARPSTVAPPGNLPHVFWFPGPRRRR
jgi:hypothetical protein